MYNTYDCFYDTHLSTHTHINIDIDICIMNFVIL